MGKNIQNKAAWYRIFSGMDSSGKKVIIYESSIYRIANGKIAEQRGFPDALSLENQLK